uniref:Uncharacterized protein n=1 Tax=Amphimedon queenslandica TaxID=400682 RepID=A0A1X7TN60_AMPQE
MWIIPFYLCVRLSFWRMIIVWSIFSIITLFVMFKATRKKLHVNTPRIVYRWFLWIYQASYALGIIGYLVLLLVFTGLGLLLPVNPDIILETGVTLVFYGVYYGVMGRDCAEVCLDYMSAAMTRTPLAMACIRGHTKIVELLLKKGANVNVTDENENTPLGIACKKGHTEIVELLLKHGIDNTNSTMNDKNCIPGTASAEGQQPQRVNINHTNLENRTALHIACDEGCKEIVELLLKHNGVDINITDKDSKAKNKKKQNKACFEARVNFCFKMANQLSAELRTPLHIACMKQHKEIVKLLLKKEDVNVNVTDKDNNTALQIACTQQHKDIVELLLKHNRVDVNVTDKKSNTPLISACIKGHTEIVKLLLKHGANVTKCDEKGLNALDIAVEEGKKGAAMAIVKSDKWKEALCSYTEVDTSDESADKICGIRRICCCKKRKSHEAKKQFTTPMRRIIKKMPDVAKVVFENCCKEDNPPDHPDHEITFNYEFLDDFDEPKLEGDPSSDSTTQNTGNDDNDEQPGAKRSYEKWPPKAKYSSENHCLNILADSPSADLLKHPLAATLLDQKWNKIGRIVYYTNLFFYFLFVILLTSYALTVHPPNSNICMEVFGNDNETSIDCFTEERFVSQIYTNITSVCLIVYSAIMIIREVFQLVLFREEYLTSFVNFIEVPLFIFTIMFASVHSNQCYCTHSWQWQIGVIAVFFSWIALIFSIRKLPVVGIYVVMFIKIFNNFIKVVVLALLLILAFAVPFYMMFYDPQDRAEGIRTPFITPWRTTVKAITMTVGELDMDSLLRQNNQRNAPDVQYPVITFSLIIVFVILMPILFLNLL